MLRQRQRQQPPSRLLKYCFPVENQSRTGVPKPWSTSQKQLAASFTPSRIVHFGPAEVVQQPVRGLTLKQVCNLTGLGGSSIYSKFQKSSRYYDPTFPLPIRLSENGRVVWLEHEIQAWMLSRVAATRNAAVKK